MWILCESGSTTLVTTAFFTWILLVGDDEAGPHDEVDEDEGVVGEGQQVPGHRYTLHTIIQQQ
jgi:hypothetical protein